jgi:hypothetical protein
LFRLTPIISAIVGHIDAKDKKMISKVLLVSATAAGLLLAQPQNASAGVDVDVNLGGSPYYRVQPYYPTQYDYPYYPRYPSYHHDGGYDENEEYDRINCWEGRRIVRSAGYRNVQTQRCHGNIYRYSGWKRGQQWRVSVDADTGHIIRARIVRSYY